MGTRTAMTLRQREALEKITRVRDLSVARLRQVIAENAHMAGCWPSEWVFEYTLTEVHKVSRAVIRALIRKGYLECRPTDGWGNEVRIREDS